VLFSCRRCFSPLSHSYDLSRPPSFPPWFLFLKIAEFPIVFSLPPLPVLGAVSRVSGAWRRRFTTLFSDGRPAFPPLDSATFFSTPVAQQPLFLPLSQKSLTMSPPLINSTVPIFSPTPQCDARVLLPLSIKQYHINVDRLFPSRVLPGQV